MKRAIRGLLVVAIAVLPRNVHAQSESVEYYGTDALGSIRITFDTAGNVIGRMDYGPFGQQLLPADAMPQERFVGNTTDGESDQGYFHARQYQSRTGRFGQVDPIYQGLFAPQAWNRYGYAANNPTTLTDPNGLNLAAIVNPVTVRCGFFVICSHTEGGSWEGGSGWDVIGYLPYNPYYEYDTGIDYRVRSGGSGTVGNSDGTQNGSGNPTPNPTPTPPTPPNPTPNPTPTPGPPDQRWLPHICGGGFFGYLGPTLKIPFTNVKAESLALLEWDSEVGGAHGGLVGVYQGDHAVVGVEAMRTWSDWQVHGSGIMLLGAEKRFGPLKDFGGLLQRDPGGNVSVGMYFGRGVGGGGLYATIGYNCQ